MMDPKLENTIGGGEKSGNIQTRHMQWKTHIDLSIKRSGKEGNNGSISNLSQVRASTKGTCP